MYNWHSQHATHRSFSKAMAARISAFVGSMTFVYLHIIWFAVWILVPIEPFPYGLLTMMVSLEAIFLSTFVMINANDAADRDRVNAEADYKTNVDAKKEIETLIAKLDTIETGKLDALIRSVASLSVETESLIAAYRFDRTLIPLLFPSQMRNIDMSGTLPRAYPVPSDLPV